jgi:hypothetical protein
MDIFDLYPINYDDNDKNEFFILDELIKKLLKKKKKKLSIKKDHEENINLTTPIATSEPIPSSLPKLVIKKKKEKKPKKQHIEEIIINLEKMKNMDKDNIIILRKLILKYLPICKDEIEAFNEIILQSQQFLSLNVTDVLIQTNFIDSYTEEILNKTNFIELHAIVCKMLEILHILVDYYLILNNEFLV